MTLARLWSFAPFPFQDSTALEVESCELRSRLSASPLHTLPTAVNDRLLFSRDPCLTTPNVASPCLNNSFYIILTTCVIARRAEWLRNALLAPALVFPAVSALHGIVLASNHVPGTGLHVHRSLGSPTLCMGNVPANDT